MKKILLFLFALVITSSVIGQLIPQYSFNSSSGAFTAISGGTVLGTGTIDDDVYNANNIGFSFTFNGIAYTQFSVNVNGWICMGATAVSSYTPISSGTSNNVISAAGRDLQGLSTGELRYQVLGTTPNQTLVVQWLHFQKYGSTGTGDDFSFQIRLSETTNQINIVYGSFVLNANSTTVEVGLRGASNLEYNNRTTTTNWAATTAGTINSASCTLSNTVFPANGQTFTWNPPPPCATPLAQPTALILTPSTTTINGTFTASGTADSYLVIRSLSSTLSATPVNGTVYLVGTSLGGGTVDFWGSGTAFTSTLLTPNTPYYYFIFAANNFCIGSPPLYLTTSPLTGNTSTLPVFPISGNKTIGPTGDFFTLTAAFAYLNANGVNGALNLILQSTYVSTVEPAFPIPALYIPGASATNKVTVYPSATGLSITSASATGTINLTGASFITFDGRVNATGSTKSLVIENTSTTGYAIQFVNGSTYDGVNYCIVKSANQAASSATILFGSTTGTTGNSNNTIDNCEIRDGISNPCYAICSNGSASPILFNSNNTISNNLIHDFYTQTLTISRGIALIAGATGWNITGNSFYQSALLNPTVAVAYHVMFISSGDGYSITNNYIGGSAPNCGGTPWTITGNGTPPTLANVFYGIWINTGGSLTVNPSTFQGNTVANITLYNNPGASSIYFTGFICVVGIWNVTNNVIGAATGTGSITINEGLNASGYNPAFEGIDFRGMYGNVQNNTVGSITLNPPAGSASTLYLLLRALSITPTVQNSNVAVSGNLIGSLTTASSIQCPSVSFPPVIMQGLLVNTTGTSAATMTVSNNTIANLTDLSSHATSYMYGLYDASTTVPIISTGNTIRDLTAASQNLTIAGASSIVGFYSTNPVPGSIIRSNLIYNLANTDLTAAVGVNGMYIAHSAGSLLCEKNFIHNVSTASSSATSQVNGMYINCSGTYVTAKNNMIQLGININGTANTASSVINGIYETGATIDSILNNSIYIGGAPTAGTTGSTYAFNSTIAPSLSTPRVYLNNIFVNTRSGGTTGLHYGIKVGGTTQFPLGLTSNYNLILANGATGGTFGSFNAVDRTTFAAWKAAVGTDIASGNADPNFVAPNGTSVTANLHIQTPTPIEAAGIALSNVTDDFDSQLRSGLTPPDVGADAGNFTLSADVFGPNITYVPIGNGVVAATRVLSNWATITDNVAVSGGASLPRIYYKKFGDANLFVGNTSSDNGWKYVVASNSSSPYSFTINYGIINGGTVSAADVIQYFVVAQDAANNLSSWYPMAGASANPPVQNINAAPATVQSYTIVSTSIPLTINVPGTYPTLTGTGGAFDMINQGVLVGNTTINITADVTEPGTVALNAWSEDPPGSNYKLLIKPDASTLRTISGTATLAAGTGLIRTNGASRFTIDGGAGKLLTFRFTNTAPASNQPTIQFNNGSVNDSLKNCTIESNSSSSTYGTINIGYLSTAANTVVIMGNDIRGATAGTVGLQNAAIVSASILNTVKIVNNNIYNFNNYGFYTSGGVADGAVITGNSFYFNSAIANTSAQYCIYFSSGLNNHTISGNYFGGQAPLCGGSAWTNTTTNSIYGIYGSVGVIIPTTIANNTIQNFNLSNTGSAYFYGIYMTAGVLNILNNMIGSPILTNSITSAGTGYFYGIYATSSAVAPTNIQGNTIAGLNYTSTTSSAYFYLMYISTGLFKVGTTAGNIIGSNTVANSISYAGTGYIYGIYNTSNNPGNAIENNILGNWTLTGTSGSPYIRAMYIYSANVKKNKIFGMGSTNAAQTPYIYGIFNNNPSTAGTTNEYSNNLISLDGGAATNPTIYGYYDYWNYVDYFNFYYNDIYISGPATTTSTTYAMYRASFPSYSFYTMYNNNIINKRAAGGTGKHYAEYVFNTGSCNSNNNNVYSLAGPLGYYGADITTFASWQTTTGTDLNSVSVDPNFVSATDLHTNRLELNNAGLVIPAVTTDYSGVTRGTPPDIGSYEFSLSPVVTTIAATGITGTGATVNGSVNAQNESVAASFEYGLTIAYGGTITAAPATIAGTVTTTMNAGLSGLQPASLYHYRAKGVANALNYYGVDMTFTTLAIPPVVVTTAATAITGTGATVNGTVNANNSSTTVTFEYGLTTAYGSSVPGVPSPVTGTIVTNASAVLTGLLPCTLYHYRINGTNAGGTANGLDLTFTTLPSSPSATTTAASGIGTTTATLNGIVNANCANSTVTFNWGLTAAYGNSVPGTPSPVTGNAPTPVSASLTGLVINTTYHYQVCATNANGTSCGTDMTFLTGCPQAGPAGPITGPSTACQGGCGYVYTVAPILNASGYVWSIPVGGTITSGANTNSITVCYSASAVSGYVTVYGTALCGNGTTSPPYLVTVNAAATPTITGPASACLNVPGNVYTTQAGMTNYIWAVAGGTITAGGTTSSPTATVTWTSTGVNTISVNYNNTFGCPGIAPTVYNVTVNALPNPTISGNSAPCQGTSAVYTTQPGMTGYTWAVSAGGTITGGAGTNVITVLWNNSGAQTVSINYANAAGCTAAAPTIYNLNVIAAPTPTITGPASMCVNSGYYTYSTQSGFASYGWTISSGGIMITGQGTSSIMVNWIAAGPQTVSVNVTNATGCWAVNPPLLNVTVNPLPDPAGSVTGSSAVCGGASNVSYSVAPIPNAITYVWTLPAGATIASGAGTNSITVNFAGNASSGNITVFGNNLCGDGLVSPPFPVTVTALPANAGIITGPASVCQGTMGVIYSVPTIPNATSYSWTVPTGATIVSGSTTNTITVDFSASASSGTVSVYGINSCGNGVPSSLNVTLNPIPATPVITNVGPTLTSNAPTGNQWYFSDDNISGTVIIAGTGQNYVATKTGWYWDVVILNGCASDSSNHIYILFVGIENPSGPGVSVYPVPNDGLFTVAITSASPDNYSISVMNNLGVKISEVKDVIVNGTKNLVIDLRPVPSGVYTVIIQNNQNKVVKKIMINK